MGRRKSGAAKATRGRRDFKELKKHAYWAIRESDERILSARKLISKAKERLRAAGKSTEERSTRKKEPDPFLAFGELLLGGSKKPKRRTED